MVLLLGALVVALWGVTPSPPPPLELAEPRRASPALDEGERERPGAPDPVPADPEVLASPRCVADLLALDAMPALDGVRAALARGWPADDGALAAYLSDLVAERVGGSVTLALEVVDWAMGASVAQARALLDGVARSSGGRDTSVGARLLELADQRDLDERVRAAALDALRAQPRLEAAAGARLGALALDQGSPAVAWHATRALGTAMAQRVQSGADSGAEWKTLAEVAKASDEPAVRALALEASLQADRILRREDIEVVVALLPHEPHRDVRELAIFQLGLTDAPTEALAAMSRAFDEEYDRCVRWAIVRFAVRAAGADALPLLERFARVDPAFAEDVADFRALFAAGYQDFEQIWLHKAERHFCSIEDGEPHGDQP